MQRIAYLGCFIVLAACGEVTSVDPDAGSRPPDGSAPSGDGAPVPDVGTLVISPQDPTIDEIDSVQLSATHIDADGESQDVTGEVFWTVSEVGVVRLLGRESVEADPSRPGEVVVTATRGDGLEAETAITVEPALESIELSPFPMTLAEDTSFGIQVTGIREDGRKRDARDEVSWSTEDSAVATVGDSSVLEAVGPGTTTVRASWDGQSVGDVEVEVSDGELSELDLFLFNDSMPVGTVRSAVVQASFADGHVQNLAGDAELQVDPPDGVVSIDDRGLLIADGPGTAEIVGAWDGVESHSVSLEVVEGEPEDPELNVPEALPSRGESVSLFLSSAHGSIAITGPPVRFESSDPDLLSVDLREAIPLAATDGEPVEVVAYFDGSPVATAEIEIVDSPPSDLDLEADSDHGRVFATASFGGVEQDVTQQAHWSSDNPDCALVDNTRGRAGALYVKDEGACEVAGDIVASYGGLEESIPLVDVLFPDGDNGDNGD